MPGASARWSFCPNTIDDVYYLLEGRDALICDLCVVRAYDHILGGSRSVRRHLLFAWRALRQRVVRWALPARDV